VVHFFGGLTCPPPYPSRLCVKPSNVGGWNSMYVDRMLVLGLPRPRAEPEAPRDRVTCRNISLPHSVWALLEAFRRDRRDPTLSATLRHIVLEGLSIHGYTTPETKKAYGVRGE
jgi:hypothetical protein